MRGNKVYFTREKYFVREISLTQTNNIHRREKNSPVAERLNLAWAKLVVVHQHQPWNHSESSLQMLKLKKYPDEHLLWLSPHTFLWTFHAERSNQLSQTHHQKIEIPCLLTPLNLLLNYCQKSYFHWKWRCHLQCLWTNSKTIHA